MAMSAASRQPENWMEHAREAPPVERAPLPPAARFSDAPEAVTEKSYGRVGLPMTLVRSSSSAANAAS
jgi:hypothetical protein